MFDLTSSKLLILGLVALIVVGPKDLPVLLRAIGKYVGLIRRQATEFRSQFDDAMREHELASLKAEMDAMKRDVETTVASTGRDVEHDLAAARADMEYSIKAPEQPAVPGPDGGTTPATTPAMTPLATVPTAVDPVHAPASPPVVHPTMNPSGADAKAGA